MENFEKSGTAYFGAGERGSFSVGRPLPANRSGTDYPRIENHLTSRPAGRDGRWLQLELGRRGSGHQG